MRGHLHLHDDRLHAQRDRPGRLHGGTRNHDLQRHRQQQRLHLLAERRQAADLHQDHAAHSRTRAGRRRSPSPTAPACATRPWPTEWSGRRAERGGFTIVEVLVATLILVDRGADDLRPAQRRDQEHPAGEGDPGGARPRPAGTRGAAQPRQQRAGADRDAAELDRPAQPRLPRQPAGTFAPDPRAARRTTRRWSSTAAASTAAARSKAASSTRARPVQPAATSAARSTATSSGATTPAAGSDCPGTQDYKQIVVAVKLDTPGNQAGGTGLRRSPVGLRRPDRQRRKRPGAGRRTATSSPRSSSSSPTRPAPPTATTDAQEITGDHLLHNTLGTCASGPQTGTDPGRARRAAARRPARPGARRPDRPAALRLLQRHLPRADARHRQGRADPPRRTPTAATTTRPARPTPSRRSTAGSPTRWQPTSR